MRASRTALVVTVVLIGLPLLAAGVGLVLVRLGAFDRAVERSLSAILGTPVSFDDLILAVASSPKIGVRGLKIAGVASGPAFAEGVSATLTLPWGVIVGEEIQHLRAVEIDAGQLNLRVDSAGRDNWTALLDRVLEMQGEGPSVFRIEELDLRDLRLRYEDAGSGLRIAIVGFTMSAKDVVPARPFPVELRTAASLGSLSAHGRLIGRAIVDPDRRHYAIDLDRFLLWAGGGSLPLAGVEAAGRIETLSYDPAADRAQVGRAQGTFAGVAFEAHGSVARVTTDPAMQFRVTTAPFAPRPFAEALGIALPATADPQALSRAELRTMILANGRAIEARDFEGVLDDTRVGGAMSIALEAGAAPRLALRADRIDLDRYLPPEEGGPPAARDSPGKDSSAATIEATVKALRALDVDADLLIDEAVAAGARFRGLRLRIEPDVRKAQS